MNINIYIIFSIVAIIIGFALVFLSDKARTEEGEWSEGLQWGYLLMLIGLFGVLATLLQFGTVMLILSVITGIVWLWKCFTVPRKQVDNNHFRDYISSFFPYIIVIFILRSWVAEPFQIPSSSMRPGLEKGDFILVNKNAYGFRMPITNSVMFGAKPIERGDVVVFAYPLDENRNFIKRFVGIPGDVIEYKDKILKINGEVVHETAHGDYVYPDDADFNVKWDNYLFQTALNHKNFNIIKDKNVPTSIDPLGISAYRHDMENIGYQDDGLKEACEYYVDGAGFTCTVPAGKYFAMGDNRDHSADSRYWGFVDEKLVVGKASYIWLNFNNMKRMGTAIQ